MTTPSSSVLILQGAKAAWQRRGILWTFYGINLLIVLPMVLMLRTVMINAVSSSPLIGSLLAGYDHTIFKDVLRHHEVISEIVLRSIVPLVMISLVLHSLLGPGLVASFDGDGSVRQFLRDSARYFWRSVRLLLAVIAAIVVTLILVIVLSGIAWTMMTEGDRIESELLAAAIVSVLIVAVPMMLIALVSEYGRIFMVKDDMSSVLKAFWTGLVFVVKHPVRMIALHGSVFIVLGVGVCLYWLVENAIGMTTAAGIFVMMLVQQASVLLRIYSRIWNTANGFGLVSASPIEAMIVSMAEPPTVVQQQSLALPMPEVVTAPRRTPSAIRRSKAGSKRLGIRPTRAQRRPPRRGRNR